MDPWRRIRSEPVQDCRVFGVERARFASPRAPDGRDFFVIRAPEWINVVPITEAGEAVLIRQYRFGIEAVTLEIPGGMCDPGESPAEAAERELLEETGYAAGRIELLGWVHPNPAIQDNRCHSFVARAARRAGDPRPDPDEQIEVVTVPLAEIPERIRDGQIRHALVIAAFHLLLMSPGASGRP